ncbi:MAG: hypothetical protein GAK30_01558 [Paracidovorax wautersii]|uniref:Uncharacterized protein n=1 Tax=Paracidovorax wautersii TaxID=1177982 RepID=A0A7V8FPP8_9BURK|nr:MAG: hypothetical protein GAK30_01558 [Paracidovorax wautersii]
MDAPKIGRVFCTAAGEQYCVSNVVTAADIDDPEVQPEFFLVYLVAGIDPNGGDGFEHELSNDEFEAWCEDNGVSL